MMTDKELTERQKNHLLSLLRIKREGVKSNALDLEIEGAIAGMDEEDVAIVEKITGVKAR